ncbi:phosphoadenylylsulfate reductase (thioredoxin) [Paraburkholderia eburnea]|uniref:Adenosine 5'-phosphosulfate reductase n=1 Tax=Paraburkholderia eburnea TaxID=1189126 RepID=A0A2S4MMN1_9BURK|nr:phosphoadenylyl-sulfate reductase [Paraburkholderia eburnea]POR55849.1 phosphoadenylylsulfate reductase (thioredoxin) [Paraburkholderia eburnea]PRZ26976.1 phosphoadenylylsulfate reductase (thioredoxin) [Paraburkholderia eburnea]
MTVASSTPASEITAEVSTQLQAKIERLDALLDSIAARHADVKLASSLAAEDMLLTHAILSRGVKIGIFSLNTGRLHAETVGMIDTVRARYGYEIEQFHPQQDAIDEYVTQHGLNAFYESVDLRKRCCEIRKVEPLNRALSGVSAWVTGQRREQSVTRAELHEEERDEARNIDKFNPLADWTEADVWTYLRAFDVPVNPLHARGYPSIGCEPCTRAIRPGEDSRAGRWWWESRDTKECGLHITSVSAIPVAVEASPAVSPIGRASQN